MDLPDVSLRVVLLQRASALDPADNRAALAAVDEAAAGPDGADLVVLPEAFARDFGERGSDLAPYAERLDGPFVTALRERAVAARTTVVAGMFEVSDDDPAKPWNTLACVGPDGTLTTYRKIHLYDSFGHRESDVLSAGAPTPVVVDVAGLQVGLMTCYDLRFPEMTRALVDAGAELVVVPSAWVAGEGKLHHWRTLLTARAIENVCWVAAAAQPAPRYTGHSLVVDPLGRVPAEAGEGDGEAVRAVVRRSDLEAARRTNPSLANRRLR